MKLLIDMGNTRVKWQLWSEGRLALFATGTLEDEGLFGELVPQASAISSISVSTVAAESRRTLLCERLAEVTPAPVSFYWTEACRGELQCAYANPGTMGADRWHAMYGGWRKCQTSFVVVDAGSAITVDFVNHQGVHLGGYILPGKQMMLRSLSQDAARIDFEEPMVQGVNPGITTTECVHNGLQWLWWSISRQIALESADRKLDKVLVTGGDAAGLLAAGLQAEWVPDLVLAGLSAIVEESVGS